MRPDLIYAAPLDDLPDDYEEELPPLVPEYELVSEFKATVRGSRITVGEGDLLITFSVPFEDKYKALPVTDVRGLTFMVGVYAPKKLGHQNPAGVSPSNPTSSDATWFSEDE